MNTIGLLVLITGMAWVGFYRVRGYAVWLYEDLCSQEWSDPEGTP